MGQYKRLVAEERVSYTELATFAEGKRTRCPSCGGNSMVGFPLVVAGVPHHGDEQPGTFGGDVPLVGSAGFCSCGFQRIVLR